MPSSPSVTADTTSTDTVASDTTASEPSDSAESVSADPSSSTMGSTSKPVSLTRAQKNRIGPTLRRLLRGDSLAFRRVDPAGSRDGDPIYGVTIESSDPAALRAAGLPLTSVQGSLITARLSLDQIRTAATVEGVNAIRAATEMHPHSPSAQHGSSPGSSMDP